ncbi:MAG: pentapeptide repeat-containing protein [Cyanobacteria bacterium P01_D01_bin.50]
MNLSIRHWLIENHIEITQIKGLSQAEITGIALRMIQDMEIRSPLAFDICTLAEVMELPLGVVWHEITVFATLTQSILQLLAQKKPLLPNEATWLAFQVAYLQALEEVLIDEFSLSRVWIERALVSLGVRGINRQGDKGSHREITVPSIVASGVTRGQGENLNISGKEKVKPLRDENLQALLKIMRGEKLTEAQGEEALQMVADSSFVQQISRIAVAWLVANSVPILEAELIIQRLENSLLGHLIEVVSENIASFIQLKKFLRLGKTIELKTREIDDKSDDKIDLSRDNYRASLIKKLGEPLFIESFSLKEIYVPPIGLPLQEDCQPVDLMNWVVSQLKDLETVTVIESESGYGKTSFCQIFAAEIAQKFYPEWIPVFISLSEVTFGETFQETLASAFIRDSNVNLSTWLKKSDNKCLLILDGLNELPHCTENKTATAIFMQQLFEFQCQKAHKIILTTQSWVLEDIFAKAEAKLRTIKIQPWRQNDWKQWFGNWAKIQSMAIAQNFFTFLKKNKGFSQKSQFLLSDFVRQPLMLYLLGILHRDELLDDQILQLATNPRATNSYVVLWSVYERLAQWLLGYGASAISKKILTSSLSGNIHRTPEAITSLLKNRHPQELIDEMQTVALQILYSGKKNIDLKGDFTQLSTFYFKITKKSVIGNSNPRHLLQLGKPAQHSGSSTVKFSHSKFGEYLCAKAIVAKLKDLTKWHRNDYGEMVFNVESQSSVAEQLYYLLGYGILTQEIEELAIEGLRREQKHKFSFELLSSRLKPFWYPYCHGRWLDEGLAHKAWIYFKELQNPVNVEQVNAAVGINVFLLLSASHRETKQTFSPCGNPASFREFNPQALISLMAKTAVFHPETTRGRIGEKSLTFLNLSKADLTQGMLAQVNFANTDLSNAQLRDACLVGANLAEADFTGADLTGANLTNANLTNAKLTGANLTGANLSGVNLDLVNLSNACLFQAIITETNKETALANGAIFSLAKFEQLKSLMSYQSRTYDKYTEDNTEIAFKETPSIGQIESAEGEPIFPVDLDSEIEDETVLGISSMDFSTNGMEEETGS